MRWRAAIGELRPRNASEPQIERCAAILAENAAAVARGDRVEARNVDVRFHAAIAEASGNVVFQAVARPSAGCSSSCGG